MPLMPKALARRSFSELQAELRRRSSGAHRLHAKRSRLVAKLDRLDAEIERMGGSVTGRGPRRGASGRRPRNAMNLTETLAKVIGSKTMNVTDAAAAVQRAGYRTNSS